MRFSALPVSDPHSSNGTLLEFVRDLVVHDDVVIGNNIIQQGGDLTINGQDLGQFDYVVKNSSQTISSSPVTAKGDNIRSLGTNIGDMTVQQGIAAVFDGDTSQATTEGASTGSVVACYVGKTYTTRIYSCTIFGSNNDGYINNINPTVTLKLYAKQGAAPSSTTDGTMLGSTSFTDTTDESTGRDISSNDTTTVWDHVWVEISQNGAAAAIRCAEAQFFQAVTQSAFTTTDWFTDRDDKAALVAIKGDLTIASGTTFTPATRKLFTCVYVTGNCAISGELSMTARGANHSATGQYAAITASEIRVANGLYSVGVNPNVPAVGGAGGLARVQTGGAGGNVGLVGTTGTAGGTGGGGSGGATRGINGTSATSGAGAAGTCFTGGSGGGAAAANGGTQGGVCDAVATGGAGGPGFGNQAANCETGGGAGNPGGSAAAGDASLPGTDGTGGVLFLIVEGTLSGTGNVTANGAAGGNAAAATQNRSGGAGSGGGSITIIANVDSSSFTSFAAAGGAEGVAAGGTQNANGGPGGDGTARKFSFQQADASNTDVYHLLKSFSTVNISTPLSIGSNVTVNGVNLGPFDLVAKQGNQTVSTFTESDWFTANPDRSALVTINGDFTLNAAQVFKPANRKLFTGIYVSGNCVLNGEISMSARGGNHSASGTEGAITSGDIKIVPTGSYSGTADPVVPAAGSAGGAAKVQSTDPGSIYGGNTGATGTAGSGGGTGGGGSGGASRFSTGTATSGAGAIGTSFGGGSGGGSAVSRTGDATGTAGGAAGANGGAGQVTGTAGNDIAAGGGAGNPMGVKAQNAAGVVGEASNGTGGIVMLFVDGVLTGSGNVSANGSQGASTGSTNWTGGAGSGGGSVTVMAGLDSSTIATQAAGGAGGGGNTGNGLATGGAGGAGSARKLNLKPSTSNGDLFTLMKDFANNGVVNTGVVTSSYANLSINGQALGSFDYVVKHGNQTVTTFTESQWFSANQDKPALIVVRGDLTVNASIIMKPSIRKLFTSMYVTGNCTINGEVSMSARGARHDSGGSQGAITAVDIRIANGTYSSVTDPQIPATGGAGGAARVANADEGNNGISGTTGTNGGLGGGGSGKAFRGGGGSGTATSGAGGTGSAFSGGAGGGGAHINAGGGSATATSGSSAGGAGGSATATTSGGNAAAGGGAGNPRGTDDTVGPAGNSTQDAANGTGGALMMFVGGTLLGTGTITAAGANGGAGGSGNYSLGGGSGGGSITVMYGADSSSITPTATGGVGFESAGSGGDGTARKLSLV